MSSIYLINPGYDFPSYFSGESYAHHGMAAATFAADLAITTLAALAPPGFDIRLCDESVSPADLDTPAKFVGISGKVTQHARMIALARAFKQRGKIVIIGGPYASLSPEQLRPHCDILVRGEVEEIAPQLYADLKNGTWKEDYEGTKPDLSASPVPRWDGYPLERSVQGTVQTSRGCPFECEFCDVIQYVGRKQRHKPPGQVLAELDALSARGVRTIFMADDNFTVYRSRAKELLLAIAHWNQRQSAGRMTFATQVSIECTNDEEMLQLLADANCTGVFVGIESPSEEALKETKKRQNLRLDLVERVQRFFAYGIGVTGGMIVGFDADGPDIFQRQLDFAMETGIPMFTLTNLIAPAATPLFARMASEGRLRADRPDGPGDPWTTNIVHPKMSEEQMRNGVKWLSNRLYDADNFGQRLLSFIEKFGERRLPSGEGRVRPDRARGVEMDAFELFGKVPQLGPKETKMWNRVLKAAGKKPTVNAYVVGLMSQYMQVRYMYDHGRFWDPRLVTEKVAPIEPLTPLRRPLRAPTATS